MKTNLACEMKTTARNPCGNRAVNFVRMFGVWYQICAMHTTQIKAALSNPGNLVVQVDLNVETIPDNPDECERLIDRLLAAEPLSHPFKPTKEDYIRATYNAAR